MTGTARLGLLAAAIGFALLASGCAGNKALMIADVRSEEMSLLCKHCNCYMPTDVDPDSKCTVCDCGYKAARCIRGK